MSSGVHTNIGTIQNIEAACARFARVLVEQLPSVEKELRQVREAVDERRDELRREICTLNDEISSADEDDDASRARSRLEDAEQELESLQRRSRRLAEAGAAYAAQARKLNYLATDHAVRTQEFLRGTMDDLKVYFAKTLNGISHNSVAAFTPATSVATAGSGDADLNTTSVVNSEINGVITTLEEGDLDAFRSQIGVLALEAKTREYEHRIRKYPELASLTVEEFLAINRYSQWDFENMNAALRANDNSARFWGAQIRLATNGLKKLPIYEGQVYRGVDTRSAALGISAETYTPGSIIAEKGFTSASQDSKSSLGGTLQLEILSKTGRDIKSCSAMQSDAADEKEVLFLPNTQFKVIARFERNGATIVQLKEE